MATEVAKKFSTPAPEMQKNPEPQYRDLVKPLESTIKDLERIIATP